MENPDPNDRWPMTGTDTSILRKSIHDKRIEARYETLDDREKLARQLLDKAVTLECHWYVGNLIDAAHCVWGKDHCSQFDTMAKEARKRYHFLSNLFTNGFWGI